MTTMQKAVARDSILIVDDDVSIVKLLEIILNEEGEIHVAYDGDEGSAQARKQDYDLIVSDIDMPNQDGLSFYAEATENKPYLKGRFLFMTGTVNDERLAYFQKHEIKHLLKPSSIKDILNAAQRILLLPKTHSSLV